MNIKPSCFIIVSTAVLIVLPVYAQSQPTEPYMGINLEKDEFVDLMKQVYSLNILKYEPGGSYSGTDYAALDAQGWPAEDCYIGFISNGHINSLDDAEYPDISGTYHISFQCASATPAIQGLPLPVTLNPSTPVATPDGTGQYLITVDVTLPSQPPSPTGGPTNGLALEFYNTTGTVNGVSVSGVRNLRVIRPGYPANTTQVFTTDYLNALSPYSVLRAMDLANTNDPGNSANSGASLVYPNVNNWSDRTLPSCGTPSGNGNHTGLAWEYLIQIANTTNEDLWINVPIGATDDYVTKLAQLMKYGSDANGNVYSSTQGSPANAPLNSNLHLYVEYSNEVWNESFPQSAWNIAATQDEVNNGNSPLTSPGNLKPLNTTDDTGTRSTAEDRRVAERLVQISNIFAGVWGASAINTTIRPVFAWQVGGDDSDECAWIEQAYGPAKNYIYGLANAPYFGTLDIEKDGQDQGLTPQDVIADLMQGVAANHTNLIQLRTGATYYGLKDLTYEGGEGTSGGSDMQAKYDAQYIAGTFNQPGIDTAIEAYYSSFYAAGGDLNLYFNQSGIFSNYGTYGILEFNSDINGSPTPGRTLPKWSAVNAVSQSVRPEVNIGETVPATGVRFNESDYLIYNLNYAPNTTYPGQPYLQYSVYASLTTPSYNFMSLFSPASSSDAPDVYNFLVSITAAGTYNILQNLYSSLDSSNPGLLQVSVDDQAQPVTTVPLGDANQDFQDVSLGSVHLGAGLHVIRLSVLRAAISSHLENLQLRELAIMPVALDTDSSAAIRFNEADYLISNLSYTPNTTYPDEPYLQYSIYPSDTAPTYNFLSLFTPATPSDAPVVYNFSVNVSVSGTYNLIQSLYSSLDSTNPGLLQFSVDGQAQPVTTAPTGDSNGDFQDVNIGAVTLGTGSHTIGLTVLHATEPSHLENLQLLDLALTPVAAGTPLAQIHCGGGAAGSWLADTDYSNGWTFSDNDTIDTSHLTEAVPAAVFQSVRAASYTGYFSYVTGGFTPGVSYTVNLYFVNYAGVGDASDNVSINGTQVLANFDIADEAGGPDIAIERSFNATADADGNITIFFWPTGPGVFAFVSGVEVTTQSPLEN